MKKVAAKFLFNFFLVCLTCNFAAANDAQKVFVVVRVNQKVITNLELIDRYNFVLWMSKIKVGSESERKNLLNQVADKMVDEELIRQEGANLKIAVEDSEIKESEEIAVSRQKKNLSQFKLSLIAKNLSYVNFSKQIEAELLWSKIVSETLRSRVKITDAEINEFFEQRKFNTNIVKFRIAQIFISEGETSEVLARKLVSELRSGADFHNIVKQFSRDSLTAENGGEFGWVAQGDIEPKIYAAISRLKNNEYSDPVLVSDGYYIFKVLDQKKEVKIEERDLNAARNQIFIKKLQTLAKGHLMDLRKKAFVEVDREKISKL